MTNSDERCSEVERLLREVLEAIDEIDVHGGVVDEARRFLGLDVWGAKEEMEESAS